MRELIYRGYALLICWDDSARSYAVFFPQGRFARKIGFVGHSQTSQAEQDDRAKLETDNFMQAYNLKDR